VKEEETQEATMAVSIYAGVDVDVDGKLFLGVA
jgi:hypothetical protein